jgi:hypothetical protein
VYLQGDYHWYLPVSSLTALTTLKLSYGKLPDEVLLADIK